MVIYKKKKKKKKKKKIQQKIYIQRHEKVNASEQNEYNVTALTITQPASFQYQGT